MSWPTRMGIGGWSSCGNQAGSHTEAPRSCCSAWEQRSTGTKHVATIRKKVLSWRGFARLNHLNFAAHWVNLSLSLSLSSLCSLDISRCICIYNYSIVYLYSIAFLPWQAPMAELTPISSALKAHIVMACSMFTAQVQIPQAKEVAQHYMDFLLPTRRHSGIDAGDPKTCTRRLLYWHCSHPLARGPVTLTESTSSTSQAPNVKQPGLSQVYTG